MADTEAVGAAELADVELAADIDPGTPPPQPKVPNLKPVFMSVFIDAVSLGIAIPVLPYYALRFGASPLDIGWLMCSFAAAQIVGSLGMGWLSDKIGRRPVLLLSLFGSSLGFLLGGFANSLVFLFLSRAVAGLFGGSIPTAQAYIADCTTVAQRPKYFGLVGVSIGCGFTIGPGMGGLIAKGIGFEGALFCASGCSFLAFLYACKKLEAPVPVKTVPDKLTGQLGPMGTVVFSMLLVEYAWQTMTTVYPLWMQDNFGSGSMELGFVLLGSGVILIFVQGAIHGLIHKAKVGKHAASALGAVLMGVGIMSYPRTTMLGPHFLLFAVQVIGYSIEQSALPATLSRYAPKKAQGRALGLGQAAKSAARIAGPLAAGYLYDDMLLPRHTAFTVAGVVALTAAVVLLTLLSLNKRWKAKSPPMSGTDEVAELVIGSARDAGCPAFGDGGATLLLELLDRSRAACPMLKAAYGGDSAALEQIGQALRNRGEGTPGQCPHLLENGCLRNCKPQ